MRKVVLKIEGMPHEYLIGELPDQVTAGDVENLLRMVADLIRIFDGHAND